MKLLLVTYDLKKPGRDYSGLYDTLKKASDWWHYMESCWLLRTNLTPNQWVDKIRTHLDSNDYLFVVEITRNYQGLLPKKAWDWISKYDKV